ncbi:MAG: AAA family ATPase, partial [Actinobacteria bacterium]|nr:AAA family ATPase [Actinomycetota bacterium]
MLTSIEIRGFKSFAGRTRLDFGPGINVVVGPNGSGKSNLAEAVAWAFGEQRASRLRAPAMADVLYGGGTSTPPAGVAEVTVSIGDGDGAAILEATRRLTRAGETEYRLNGCDCRLLDLQDELAGRGLGPDSLAIIRQGQVEAICMSRPGDRRAMLDDAAGVGVSKRRRHRAELKLARVADRLDRARDIAGEIASRGR